MVTRYRIHGLILELPFPCEELGAPADGDSADLRVTAGEVSRILPDAELRDGAFDMTPTSCLYRGGVRSARFLGENGDTIIFRKNGRCEDDFFWHHLLYPVMAAVLWQRGLFVLHASSVISPHGAVLVTGESGAGKSTTVARLLTEGWPLQTDDVSALCPGADGVLEVMPGARRVHLHEDSAAQLGLDTQGLPCHDWHRMKVAVPALVAAKRRGCAVGKIVYLYHAPVFKAETVRGQGKLPLMLKSLYGPLLPQKSAAHYDLLGKALNEIEMIAIGRPPGCWTMEDVVRAIGHG